VGLILSSSDRDQEVRQWLNDFATCVRARNLNAGRDMFTLNVAAFGTRNDMMRGIDELVERQWAPTWSATHGFTFDESSVALGVSDDGLQAWASAPWVSGSQSTAVGGRKGRATFILKFDDRWKCIHSHLSYSPTGEL